MPLTMDPGHPPIVNIARSHKLAVSELGSAIEVVGVPFDSSSFGRKMLNIVNAIVASVLCVAKTRPSSE